MSWIYFLALLPFSLNSNEKKMNKSFSILMVTSRFTRIIKSWK